MIGTNHQYLAGLVVRSSQKDTAAFTELYTLTCHKVYHYALQYLKDEYLAEDALQEIYITAYYNMEKLNDPFLFIAWLNRISFHVCYDMRQKQTGLLELGDPELMEYIPDEHPGSDPEAFALYMNEVRQLRLALEELPSHEREVLMMRFFHEMKLEEIARNMGLSRSTVKRYIAAGKAHLAKKLQG